MLRVPPPFSLFPLFFPGAEEAFLDRVLALPSGGAPHLHEERLGRERDTGAALELLVARSCAALNAWALPVLPNKGTITALGVPDGAHPMRLEAYLRETEERTGGVDRADADMWREHFYGRHQAIWRTTGKADAAVWMFRGLCPSLAWRPALPVMAPWEDRLGALAGGLGVVLGAAAALHAYGVDVPYISSGGAARQDARAVVLDVFRRHAVGESFPVPSLEPADLLIFTGYSRAELRSLVVMIASGVLPHGGNPTGV